MEIESDLWRIGIKAIQDLEVERGILASGKEELFGCIFGRDALITSLLLLRAYENTQNAYFLTIVRKVLINLAKLQGRETNRESGEELGKIIHEFRPENHEHLTKALEHPWYVYPDGIMRNYDTVDATPLFLVTLEKYYRLSNDAEILELLSANIHDALTWMFANSDMNKFGFLTYQFHPERMYGGLRVQSWMDSSESLFFEDSGQTPTYSIASIEVQAYAYRAYRVWSEFLQETDPGPAAELREKSRILKENFNKLFILPEGIAYALDGKNRPLISARSSMGHCLWMGERMGDGSYDSILTPENVSRVAERLIQPDMFEPAAGIRTLSKDSSHFEANSYHNGSIWPHDTAITIEGLIQTGYLHEAAGVRAAILRAYEHFQTPIELFIYVNDAIEEYRNSEGQGACRLQAWSAAGLLALLSENL